jgi:hypothetical protein
MTFESPVTDVLRHVRGPAGNGCARTVRERFHPQRNEELFLF